MVASGRDKELSIEDKCRGQDLALREMDPAHFAACYAADLGVIR